MYDIADKVEVPGVAREHAHNAIVQFLRRRHARRIHIVDRRISFAGPWFTRDLDYLLSPISSAEVVVEEVNGGVRVVWRLSLSRVRYACVFFFLASVALSFLTRRPVLMIGVIFLGSIVAWCWIYGLHWILTGIRFRAAMMTSVASTRPKEQQPNGP